MAKDKHNANIKKEWTISVLDSDNYGEIERICKALGSQIRLNLIKQLTYKPMTVVELAKLNKVTNSTILFHLDLLTAAGVVESRYLPGIKGKAQVFFTNFTKIAFSRVADEKDRTMFFRQ
uniref:ArsR/SmtB family transcription factor n=1 Tax=Candidatus Fimenecus sp. TaxID=3022888 RepID=UPI00402879BB